MIENVNLYKERLSHNIDVWLDERRCAERSCSVRPSVTISRETGCRAIPVSEILTKRLNSASRDHLNWTLFDCGSLRTMNKDPKLVKQLDTFLSESHGEIPEVLTHAYQLDHDVDPRFQAVADSVRKLCTIGYATLVGRGANYIAFDMGQVFRVRIVAPEATRVEEVLRHFNYEITHARAKEWLHETDHARAKYVRTNLLREIDDPFGYQMTINRQCMDDETVADTILHGLECWMRCPQCHVHWEKGCHLGEEHSAHAESPLT